MGVYSRHATTHTSGTHRSVPARSRCKESLEVLRGIWLKRFQSWTRDARFTGVEVAHLGIKARRWELAFLGVVRYLSALRDHQVPLTKRDIAAILWCGIRVADTVVSRLLRDEIITRVKLPGKPGYVYSWTQKSLVDGPDQEPEPDDETDDLEEENEAEIGAVSSTTDSERFQQDRIEKVRTDVRIFASPLLVVPGNKPAPMPIPENTEISEFQVVPTDDTDTPFTVQDVLIKDGRLTVWVKNCRPRGTVKPDVKPGSSPVEPPAAAEPDSWPESAGARISTQNEWVESALRLFIQMYPGEYHDDGTDDAIFRTCVRSDADIATLHATFKERLKTRKFLSVTYTPSFYKYFSRGDWRTPPKPSEYPQPEKANGKHKAIETADRILRETLARSEENAAERRVVRRGE